MADTHTKNESHPLQATRKNDDEDGKKCKTSGMRRMNVWITHGLLRDCAEHKQGLSLGLFTIPPGPAPNVPLSVLFIFVLNIPKNL